MLFAVALLGALLLLAMLVRIFWRRLKGLWEKAKQGGAIPSAGPGNTPCASPCPRWARGSRSSA